MTTVVYGPRLISFKDLLLSLSPQGILDGWFCAVFDSLIVTIPPHFPVSLCPLAVFYSRQALWLSLPSYTPPHSRVFITRHVHGTVHLLLMYFLTLLVPSFPLSSVPHQQTTLSHRPNSMHDFGVSLTHSQKILLLLYKTARAHVSHPTKMEHKTSYSTIPYTFFT